MNETIEKFHKELKESILKTKNKEGIIEFETILDKRREWIENYKEEDKTKVLEYILEKDIELKVILEEKMKTLQEKIIQEDTLNKNREAFKLYD